jgi:hypothetical protein
MNRGKQLCIILFNYGIGGQIRKARNRMIRIDKSTNEASIAGTGAEILTDLTIAMLAMYDSIKDDAKPALTRLLHEAVEHATTPEEKIREEIAKKAILKLIRQLAEEANDGGKDNSDK